MRLSRILTNRHFPDGPFAAAIGAEVDAVAGGVPDGVVVVGAVDGDLDGAFGAADVEDPDVVVVLALGVNPLVAGISDTAAVLAPRGVVLVRVGGVGEVLGKTALVAHSADVAL